MTEHEALMKRKLCEADLLTAMVELGRYVREGVPKVLRCSTVQAEAMGERVLSAVRSADFTPGHQDAWQNVADRWPAAPTSLPEFVTFHGMAVGFTAAQNARRLLEFSRACHDYNTAQAEMAKAYERRRMALQDVTA